MKCFKPMVIFSTIFLLFSCQLRFKQTGENTYTLIGIRSNQSIQRENQLKKQERTRQRIQRADFLLDRLETERSETIAMFNPLAQMELATESMLKETLNKTADIDKNIEYIKKKKEEILDEK